MMHPPCCCVCLASHSGEAENQLATLADKDRQANKNALKGAGGGAAAAARKGAKVRGRGGAVKMCQSASAVSKLGEGGVGGRRAGQMRCMWGAHVAGFDLIVRPCMGESGQGR
jgi:hypothetical protein